MFFFCVVVLLTQDLLYANRKLPNGSIFRWFPVSSASGRISQQSSKRVIIQVDCQVLIHHSSDSAGRSASVAEVMTASCLCIRLSSDWTIEQLYCVNLRYFSCDRLIVLSTYELEARWSNWSIRAWWCFNIHVTYINTMEIRFSDYLKSGKHCSNVAWRISLLDIKSEHRARSSR